MSDALIQRIIADAPRSDSLRLLQSRVRATHFLRSGWLQSWSATAKAERSIGLITWLRYFLVDRDAWAAHCTLGSVLKEKETLRGFLNEKYTRSVLYSQAEFFDSVEANPLTERQRAACASDEDATLVLAGAGTGKTSTILAKIGLLLRTGQCQPEEILAISFTNKSTKELADRVRKRLGVDVPISTFHKLGLGILAQATGAKPLVAPFAADPIEKAKHLDAIFDALKSDQSFLENLVEFCAYYRFEAQQLWNFGSLSEYATWLQSNRIVSLDGIPKKSYQECVIANWLILNGVEFEYEKPYEYDTSTPDHRQYCPDFWIPAVNLYVEHFGVDEKGNTAPYINRREYHEGMAWKRERHLQYETRLLETYSWEHQNGILLQKLSAKLKQLGCPSTPITPKAALHLLNRTGIISTLSELIATFLTLYKGNGNRVLNQKNGIFFRDNPREAAFLKLFKPIFDQYQKLNQARGQIDFEDMIARATEAVDAGRFKSPYRYILIDEFQDISPGRANLVKALRASHPDCVLFAVGDDWQSIYRFAGSDIGGMTQFSKLFGVTRQVELDTTFRFDSTTADVSSSFILKNKIQIPKQLKTVRQSEIPSLIVYRRPEEEAPLDWALAKINQLAAGSATILILERYRFHLPPDEECRRLAQQFPKLLLRPMSIHGAKGLEADYVILGLRGGYWGFPSQLADDPLFDLVLSQADTYPNGEERRLFYVAITRARQKTIVVAETGLELSLFTAELLSAKEYPIQWFGVERPRLVCKKCGSGTLLLRNEKNGRFYECSNAPVCRQTAPLCTQCRNGALLPNARRSFQCHLCQQQARACPKCWQGVLQLRKGPRGAFYGCSHYTDVDIRCKYTEPR